MKKTIFFLLFSMTLFAQAPTSFQYGVRTPTLFPWNGTNKIDVNGRLKLNTTAGGFIPASVTTTQRLAISSPQVGESVYDTTLNKYYHWDGSSWVISGGGGGASDLEGVLAEGNVADNFFSLESATHITQIDQQAVNVKNKSTTAGVGISEQGVDIYTDNESNGVELRTDNVTSGFYFVQFPDKVGGTTETIAMLSDIPSGDYLPLAGGTMDTSANINFTNGSKVSEGSFDSGMGGSNGISLTCAVGYEWNFQAGEAYLVRLSDNKIQVKEYARSVPTLTDDSSKGYENGSVWNMVDHNTAYVCTSPTIGAATWDLKEFTYDPGTVDTNYVRNGISGWVEGYSKTQADTLLDGKQNNDSDLTDISALAPPNDNILQRKAGAWTSRTPAQLKTDLSLEKADVGLSNVDNTSDVNKPVSTAVSTEYNSASALTFSGPIDLSKKGGSYYAEHTQTGAITFSVSATTVGGLAQVTIIANGNAINLVGGWINVGGEPVSTVSGTTNYMVVWQTNNKVFYSVKVY